MLDDAVLFARVVSYFRAVSSGAAVMTELPPWDLKTNLARLDALFHLTGANIAYGGTQPCYVHGEDRIYMPYRSHFVMPYRFYEVMAHELVHWTGARHRLNRQYGGWKGLQAYALEEYVAQYGSMLLLSGMGAPTGELNQSYLVGYASSADEAEAMMGHTRGEAKRAVDFIMDITERNGRR